MNLSWGASLGSQILAEISLLEANAKQAQDKCETFSTSGIGSTSIVAGSDQSVHEEVPLKIKATQLLSNTQSDQISAEIQSASTSLIGLLNSDLSELKNGTSSNIEKRPNSVPVHSPLSCSTPVANPTPSLRKASLRSSTILKLQLQNWGLPSGVTNKYAEKKITTLFPWQVDCLQTGEVLNGGNLIYSAPTSSGKTLVSELLMLKTVTERKKKGKAIVVIYCRFFS